MSTTAPPKKVVPPPAPTAPVPVPPEKQPFLIMLAPTEEQAKAELASMGGLRTTLATATSAAEAARMGLDHYLEGWTDEEAGDVIELIVLALSSKKVNTFTCTYVGYTIQEKENKA